MALLIYTSGTTGAPKDIGEWGRKYATGCWAGGGACCLRVVQTGEVLFFGLNPSKRKTEGTRSKLRLLLCE